MFMPLCEVPQSPKRRRGVPGRASAAGADGQVAVELARLRPLGRGGLGRRPAAAGRRGGRDGGLGEGGTCERQAGPQEGGREGAQRRQGGVRAGMAVPARMARCGPTKKAAPRGGPKSGRKRPEGRCSLGCTGPTGARARSFLAPGGFSALRHHSSDHRGKRTGASSVTAAKRPTGSRNTLSLWSSLVWLTSPTRTMPRP